MTIDVETDDGTGLIDIHKITDVERAAMVEDMINHLKGAVDFADKSDYQPIYHKWLNTLIECWERVPTKEHLPTGEHV